MDWGQKIEEMGCVLIRHGGKQTGSRIAHADDPPDTGPYGDLAFATYMTPVPEPSVSALCIIALQY